MTKIIIIAGAPGSGKSTVASIIQEKLGSPLFEFGWIPEFRNTGDHKTKYKDDEEMSFENLSLVVKNYIKHGYKNIIITDLENKRITDIEDVYNDLDYKIFTLRLEDDNILKTRVLDESRSSGYRDWQSALSVNKQLKNRNEFPNEEFIDTSNEDPEEIANHILQVLFSSS